MQRLPEYLRRRLVQDLARADGAATSFAKRPARVDTKQLLRARSVQSRFDARQLRQTTNSIELRSH